MSRYHSLEHPVELQEGMVFAVETYWPTPDGSSAARIEEEVVIGPSGPRVITKFPADQLYVAGIQYWTGFQLPTAGGVAAAGPAVERRRRRRRSRLRPPERSTKGWADLLTHPSNSESCPNM